MQTPLGEKSVTAREVREELHRVMSQNATFEKKAHDALLIGTTYLDTEDGYLVRVDPETNYWKPMISTAQSNETISQGPELNLSQTYCRHTVAKDGSFVLNDASAQAYASDPTLQLGGYHCYHGTTLYLDGEPSGVVFFISEDARKDAFTEEETMLAELITHLLSGEVEHKHYETELTRRNNLINILNRVLRHNLRNDMNVIRGHVRLMSDQLQDETFGSIALQKIDQFMNLSQKARDLEKIVRNNAECAERNIITLLKSSIADITANFPSASVTLESDEGATVAVLPSFERALYELIENAAKHGGSPPNVRIAVESLPKAVEVRIADNGSGLSEQEQEVLATGAEAPLTHGSGLGLWIVYRILSTHDGDVEVMTTNRGTTVTVSLPCRL